LNKQDIEPTIIINLMQSTWVKFFDYYGKEFTLKVHGQDKYHTLLGSIVGFVSIILILTLCTFSFMDLLRKNDLSVIYTQDETIIPTVNLTDLPILFTMSDITGKKIPQEGVYSFEVQFLKYENVKDSNGHSRMKLDFLNIPFKNCDKSDFANYPNQLAKINPKDFFCLNTTGYNLTLFGRYGDVINGFSLLQVFFKVCKNSTSEKRCKDEDYLNSLINNSRMILSHISYQINHYNYETPNELKLNTLSVSVSTTLTKRYSYFLQENNYETDYGQVFQNRIKSNFFKFDQYLLDVDSGELNSLTGTPYNSQISIRSSNYVSYYFRSYTKIQTLVANIGGVIKFIMLISSYFVSFMTDNLVYQNLSNVIFNFEEDSEKVSEKLLTNNVTIIRQLHQTNTIRQTKFQPK
jgi:hypothetical protein